MFQNFGHYPSGQSNQDAYLQAMYRQQYQDHDTPGMRASPSWSAGAAAAAAAVSNCGSIADEAAIAYSNNHSRLSSSIAAAAGLQSSSSMVSSGSPMSASASGSAVNCNGRGSGPTPDSYFRNPASINGLHPYSYAAEAAAAAAAACAWAGRLDHPAASGLGRMDAAGGPGGFPGLTSQSAFRRSGMWSCNIATSKTKRVKNSDKR